MFIDEETRQRVVTAKHGGDIVYPAQSTSDQLNNESVKVIGGWKDYTGSGGVNSKEQNYNAGTENELFATEASLEGAKLPNLNEVGETASIWRRRQRLIYKRLDK